MARRLLLDTSVLIAHERGDRALDTRVDDDLAIAAISLAEYGVGAELAATETQRRARAAALGAMRASLTVLDYSSRTAAHHARLLATVHGAGRPRGAHDLIIAAHAVESEREILSLDRRADFADLPGVVLADR